MRSSLVLLLVAAFVLAGECQISLPALSLADAKVSLHTSRDRISNFLHGGTRESSTSLSGHITRGRQFFSRSLPTTVRLELIFFHRLNAPILFAPFVLFFILIPESR